MHDCVMHCSGVASAATAALSSKTSDSREIAKLQMEQYHGCQHTSTTLADVVPVLTVQRYMHHAALEPY